MVYMAVFAPVYKYSSFSVGYGVMCVVVCLYIIYIGKWYEYPLCALKTSFYNKRVGLYSNRHPAYAKFKSFVSHTFVVQCGEEGELLLALSILADSSKDTHVFCNKPRCLSMPHISSDCKSIISWLSSSLPLFDDSTDPRALNAPHAVPVPVEPMLLPIFRALRSFWYCLRCVASRQIWYACSKLCATVRVTFCAILRFGHKNAWQTSCSSNGSMPSPKSSVPTNANTSLCAASAEQYEIL